MGISVDEPSVGGSSDTSSAVPTREIFWNLPNTITVLRTLAVPVLLLLPVFDTGRLGSQVIAGCFIVAALTVHQVIATVAEHHVVSTYDSCIRRIDIQKNTCIMHHTIVKRVGLPRSIK